MNLTQVLGANAQTLDWNGLDGDTDRVYRLKVWGEINAGGTLELIFNAGDTAVALWTLTDLSSGPTRGTDETIGPTSLFTAGEVFCMEFVINALRTPTGGAFGPIGRFNIATANLAGNDMQWLQGILYSPVGGSNITRIRLSGAANFFKTGTHYTIEAGTPPILAMGLAPG